MRIPSGGGEITADSVRWRTGLETTTLGGLAMTAQDTHLAIAFGNKIQTSSTEVRLVVLDSTKL